MNKKLFIILFIFVCTIFSACFAYGEFEEYNLKAKVIEAGEEEIYDDGYNKNLVQKVKIRITDKRFNGQEFDIIYYLEDGINTRLPLYDKCKTGDKVYAYGIYENGVLTVDAVSFYDKTQWIILIGIIYAVMIIIFGGKKGLKALVSLGITIALIFCILVPGILSGQDAILLTILLCCAVIALTFAIISGLSKKTLVAVFGTIAGVVAAGIIGLTFSHLMRLTGINEHARMISTVIPEEQEMISFKNILLSSIMIGALGACMDVGMSISSALYELKEKKPDLDRGQLIKSGMNIGRDVMGTMTNTLILAYVGSAMLCILLYSVNEVDLGIVLNAEDITNEVLKSLAGSIGLICTIPFTALLGGIILGGPTNDKSFKKEKDDDDDDLLLNYFKG